MSETNLAECRVADRRARVVAVLLLAVLAVADGAAFQAAAQVTPRKPSSHRHAKPLKTLPSVTGVKSLPAPPSGPSMVSPYARAAARQAEGRAALAPSVPSQPQPR